MIGSSAQVKPLSATLVVHRVHKVKLKEQVKVFFFSSKSPSHLVLILNSHPPSYCGMVLATGQDEPFCPLPYCPLTPSPVVSMSPAVLCTGLSKLSNGRESLVLLRTSCFVHAQFSHVKPYMRFLHKNSYSHLQCSHTVTREGFH